MGRIPQLLDVLSQRLKALEGQASGKHWSVTAPYELVPEEQGSVASQQETEQAAREAIKAGRVKNQAGRPYGATAAVDRGEDWRPDAYKGKSNKGQGKGKDWRQKGEGKPFPKGKEGEQERDKNRAKWGWQWESPLPLGSEEEASDMRGSETLGRQENARQEGSTPGLGVESQKAAVGAVDQQERHRLSFTGFLDPVEGGKAGPSQEYSPTGAHTCTTHFLDEECGALTGEKLVAMGGLLNKILDDFENDVFLHSRPQSSGTGNGSIFPLPLSSEIIERSSHP